MPYRIKGTLKLPSGQPAAGVDIEFISRRNYSSLLMDLSSTIKTTQTGAYDITLEFGEYAVVVYWGCNQPSHIGKMFVYSDTATGLDLQTLLQQSDWQPATPEYIQQIQDWLTQANAYASQASESAAAAKASENAVEADRAEVASNKTIVIDAQSDVTAKAADISTKAEQVATKAEQVAANTVTVSEKTPLAVAAADTASQKAVSAAASDASAREAATRAENAALAMTGAILDGGQCDLSSGFYPQPLTVNGQKYSTVWYVKVGGTVGGVTYDAGDKLQYTTANSGFYFRIDARDDVVSVNGKKGAVTLNAQEIGADQAGTATALVDQHAQKVGAHAISGVAGLEARLVEMQSKITELESWPKSGGNERGSWIKHRDGTLECWYRGSITFGITFPYGALFQATGTWSFPESFVDVPVVSSPAIQIRTAAVWGGVVSVDTERAVVRYFDVISSPSDTGTVSVSAIGRWK